MPQLIDGDIRILILHGNLLAGELISKEFNRQADFRRVLRTATVEAAIEEIPRHDVGVVLISSKLRESNSTPENAGALAAIERLHSVFPHLKLILLMAEPDRSTVTAAFRNGARGVFHSVRSDLDALLKCVRCVHAGQIWASTAELELVMRALKQPARAEPPHAVLTTREKDVVRLLVAGMTNRDIAHELRLSEHTVKNYMFRIFDKVGVSSRVELLLYAVRHLQDVAADRDQTYPETQTDALYAHAS